MSSPISVLLDTMGIEDLCAKYYISLRQSLFMGSLYLILIGNLLLLILTTALQKVSGQQALWKFHDFPVIQILREINF